MKKTVLLLLLAVLAFAAAGYCVDAGIGEDGSGHHCLVCCGAGHYGCVPQSGALPSPLLAASPAVIAKNTSYQDLFVPDIDRPPAVSL